MQLCDKNQLRLWKKTKKSELHSHSTCLGLKPQGDLRRHSRCNMMYQRQQNKKKNECRRMLTDRLPKKKHISTKHRWNGKQNSDHVAQYCSCRDAGWTIGGNNSREEPFSGCKRPLRPFLGRTMTVIQPELHRNGSRQRMLISYSGQVGASI